MGETEDAAAKAAMSDLVMRGVGLFLAPALLLMLGWIGHTLVEAGQGIVGLDEKVTSLRSEFRDMEARHDSQLSTVVNVEEQLQREVSALQATENVREREDRRLRPETVSPN